MSKELIRLSNCTMSFDDEVVLDNINLYFNDKEFLTLLGPSGCGKTTMLRIIGGFLKPTKGDVFFDGVRINDVPPNKRMVNTVFQKYALFPHLNVFENVAFGLRIKREDGKKLSEKEISDRVLEMLEVVSLKGFENRDVSSLSGGQQQRVAIARALVNRPKVLLLDEPLGALDMRLRKDMQIELKRIQQAMDITFIYVTHDQEEALAMSDTVVVMDGGVIQQIGTPESIYNEPTNAFVADFIGESNIIDGHMLEDCYVEIYGRKFKCLDKGFAPNEPVDVVIRPEDIDIVPPEQGRITGTVTSITFKGMFYDIIVDFGGFKWLIQTTDFHDIGKSIGILIEPDGIHVMKKSTYSGMFGDYSSYSEEYDVLSNADIEAEDERGSGKHFSIPYVVWMAIFVIAPLVIVVVYAFTAADGSFTFSNYENILDYSAVFGRSFLLAIIATLICLLIGYPVSYALSKEGPRFQKIALMLIMLPMWMNFLLRTYAWMSILENTGLLNKLLSAIGLPTLSIINTPAAVVIGMVYNFLPFMILPIYSVIVKIDYSLIEAAHDLGARGTSVFGRVIFPLSLPGVLSGITMVFVPAVSTFVISQLLGGGRDLLLGDLIEMQFLGTAYNPHLGSAIALVMMVIVIICMVIMNKFGEGEEQAVML